MKANNEILKLYYSGKSAGKYALFLFTKKAMDILPALPPDDSGEFKLIAGSIEGKDKAINWLERNKLPYEIIEIR